MSQNRAVRQAVKAAQQTAATGRVFKFPFRSIPAVDAGMWARLETSARKPDKKRRYPVMTETPDDSI